RQSNGRLQLRSTARPNPIERELRKEISYTILAIVPRHQRIVQAEQIMRLKELDAENGLMLLVRTSSWPYMNTNHEDFIGFAKRRSEKYMLPLDGLKIRDGEFAACSASKNVFMLSTLKAELQDAGAGRRVRRRKWTAGRRRFLRCRRLSERGAAPQTDEHGSQMERQVETIRNLVESYMKIVDKTQRDIVPKTVIHIVVNELKDFLKSSMLAQLYGGYDQNQLMEESPEEAQRRRGDAAASTKATKEALKILSDVSANTTHTPTPPPVKDDWIQPDSMPAPQPPTHGRRTPVGGGPPSQPPPVAGRPRRALATCALCTAPWRRRGSRRSAASANGATGSRWASGLFPLALLALKPQPPLRWPRPTRPAQPFFKAVRLPYWTACTTAIPAGLDLDSD
uniref:dynamin GTPase n=1 Tax=Macrostomum lignano TaxID=282301 RepID=A0A1I8FS23_9PLAT